MFQHSWCSPCKQCRGVLYVDAGVHSSLLLFSWRQRLKEMQSRRRAVAFRSQCWAIIVDVVVSLQHYAQCELLPREGACSPDTSVARQFRQHVEANGVMSA